jgi:hypothetical protein
VFGPGGAAFDTLATSIAIPPGILITGHSYVFEITAIAMLGSDLATPYRLSPIEGSASVTSAIATP